MEVAEVERALDALEADGARRFDATGCDCARALLSRAEELGGEIARLLTLRAQAHVERLAQRLADARALARRELAASEQNLGLLPRARELLARSEIVPMRRTLRRLAVHPLTLATAAQRERLQRERQRRSGEYEQELAELVAALALARAVDVVPEDAGPYNPLRIASELLTRMRAVSPLYLTAQLNRLEELASLLELPELPAPAGRVLPRKRRVLKRGA